MGQQSSKSTIEAQVIFQRVGAQDVCQRRDACLTPNPVVHVQRKLTSHAACLHSSTRALEKSAIHSWPQSCCDAGGLVYVMDNPTGGVWVKPEDRWTRSWYKDWVFRQCLNAGIKSTALRLIGLHPELNRQAEPLNQSWAGRCWFEACLRGTHAALRSRGGFQVSQRHGGLI